MQTFGERRIERVEVADLLLLEDPAEEGLFLSRFRLAVKDADGREVRSTRRLYWRRSNDDRLRIVAEDSG